MFMFSILRVIDANTGQVIFEENHAASPFALRPIFLILGKEVLGNLEDVKQTIKERKELTDSLFPVSSRFGVHSISLKATLTMIDAKMRSLLTGLGGAYCLLFDVDKETACGKMTAKRILKHSLPSLELSLIPKMTTCAL